MKRSKWLRRIFFLAVFVLASILGVVIYADAREFEPYWPAIRAIMASIPEEELHLPEPQRGTMLKLAFAKNGDAQSQMDWLVARRLLGALQHQRLRPLRWQFDWFWWNLEIRARLSREERCGLYCHLMQFSGGQGLSYGSQALFHEELNQLTDEQIAEIVAIQWAGWRHYERHPEALIPDSQSLLKSKM